jgi:uncharacterized membrane protein YphA (DoxX/SURF4 family)
MYQRIASLYFRLHDAVLTPLRHLDGLAPLALRLILVPVLWMAGTHKLADFESTVAWFGNPDWGLGLPFPWLMAFLATATELIGAVLLALGLATRWIAIPLMVTMLVAATTVHLENGWQAIADPGAPFANERVLESVEKLGRAKDILREHGHYEWLTSSGNFVVLNNGIEFAATYFVMLLALFFLGGGRYVSMDWWLARAAGRVPK